MPLRNRFVWFKYLGKPVSAYRDWKARRDTARKTEEAEFERRVRLDKEARELHRTEFEKAKDRAKERHAAARDREFTRASVPVPEKGKPRVKLKLEEPKPIIEREDFSLEKKGMLDASYETPQLTLHGCVAALTPKVNLSAEEKTVLANLYLVGKHFYGKDEKGRDVRAPFSGGFTMAGAKYVQHRLNVLSKDPRTIFSPGERRTVELSIQRIEALLQKLEKP
ncbi:MAG: hypothetical protein J4478_04425 [Candidatus Diapherotrites archaeon]|uniref:Uncharacterized protein n=1 Tax=Candidatus Iainarchaeum sp. TaxID=3101447 RepID=A0A7J4KTU0_9ARCH|nr:hypothetical protein [Candidatus Diapherotrites archaeon]HIH21622.1 hypothetical protein [Candidatus Diapherotrites archaeon]HIH33423.1 hypothetical protein [Candidatus Diapherotrites archaeon]